jgi:hypothetical protein
MDRREFEELRNLPGKIISDDIVFGLQAHTSPVMTFEGVSMGNDLGLDVVVNGAHNPAIPATKFNFVLRGVGPICRLEVGGPPHGHTGKQHKHELKEETCPGRNLPHAVPRSDLDGKSVREVWTDLCRRAGITHTGQFVDLEGE